ncbi:hypothetical protein BD309DRAFT_670305 [Dichomitus squalens]|nr:hypothetical protein BD309DRAFT_670305 [Dichomitus squalens]
MHHRTVPSPSMSSVLLLTFVSYAAKRYAISIAGHVHRREANVVFAMLTTYASRRYLCTPEPVIPAREYSPASACRHVASGSRTRRGRRRGQGRPQVTRFQRAHERTRRHR